MSVELDRKVAEAIGVEGESGPLMKVTDDNGNITKFIRGFADGRNVSMFHPSKDLNDAFWAAEQVSDFIHVSKNEASNGRYESSLQPNVWGILADTPALALCNAIIALKEQA